MHKLLLDLPARLETQRLIVRAYQPGDGIVYYEVCERNKTHLLPFEDSNPALNVRTQADAEILVRRFALEWTARDAFCFGVWEKASGTFVAQIYVGVISWQLPEFELGYFVDCDQEGKGYVTEASKAVLRWLFDHLKASRVRLNCNEMNVRSWHVAERLGFTREGHIRQTHKDIRCNDGTPSGDYLYGLLRDEFEP